ncbi:hypothetical protein [Aquabacterium sp.]|uniref:hypothetical protein n=1 Tax=Aquabacterium sp. TaxID=1872578 RepID=UPI0035B207B1
MQRTMVLVQIAEECAHDITVLLAPLQSEDELFMSQNTLEAIMARLRMLSFTLGQLGRPWTDVVREIDWAAWQQLHVALSSSSEPDHDMLWFAVSSLVPATTTLLRRGRHRHPGLFMLS